MIWLFNLIHLSLSNLRDNKCIKFSFIEHILHTKKNVHQDIRINMSRSNFISTFYGVRHRPAVYLIVAILRIYFVVLFLHVFFQWGWGHFNYTVSKVLQIHSFIIWLKSLGIFIKLCLVDLNCRKDNFAFSPMPHLDPR